ncbi:calphotin-like isoform X1 [Bombyx mandarina]|uniref:glycogenin glucosyltransferase n=1 Tax=Bombyx mandarina TaxID=7092 RepID=A0A6J2JUJ7_BOMMA|nr:calphotin-like isoform X1 [Bombyx mandarina]
MSNRAWVTLATNDSYGLGALVLAHSLRRAGSVYPAVALITPTVSEAMRDRLRAVFSEVVTVDVLDSRDAAHLALLQRPELGITFTKIHCWNLTQYEKCVFLDADILVIQNCDELFEREELSAAPDVGWPDCFNSGVFVFQPSNETFEKLIQFAQQRGSFDGGDQGLLNSFFSDWAHGDINKHLPFLYNVTTAAFYSYLPALKHYGQNLKIIHFIGAGKPWLQRFNWESRSVDAPGYLQEFLQLWWDLFVSQVHAQLDHSMSGVAGNLARVVLGSGTSTEAIDDLARRQGWEAGNIDYMGADSFDNIWAKISQTLSQPRTSPPKQLSPPKEVSPRQPTPEQVESENAEAIPETVTEAIPETVTKSIEDATVTVPTETMVEETPSQISATTNAPEVLPAVIDSDSVAVPEPAPVTSESLVAPVEVLAVCPVAIESEAIASAAVPTVTETPPSSDSTPTETETVQKPETVPATETVTVDAGETVPLDVAESAPVALDEVATEVPSEIKAADVIETASLPASESSPIVASETVLGITSEALSDVPLEIPVPVAELEQVAPTEVPTVVESETLAKPAEEPSIALVAEEPASVIPVPVEALATETELETKKESPKRLVESAKEKIETIAAATEPAAPEVPQTKSVVETIKDSTLAEPASPALAAEAPSSPAIPESTPEKPAAAGDSSTDSPPLANTPSKEEAPVVPAAKSAERRKPAGKLQLSPPAAADPLPTPDSELEDAATLAHQIIASELRTPTVTAPDADPSPTSPPLPTRAAGLAVDEPTVPTPPVGAVSLANIGVKPTKSKPVAEPTPSEAAPTEAPKKKVVKKVVKKERAPGGEAPVPPPRKKEKKPKEN